MSGHKRKRCWFCLRLGLPKTFRNRVQLVAHIRHEHPEEQVSRIPSIQETSRKRMPNVVHYGARMRKKLGLEYNKAGHLRSTLEAVA